MKYQWLTLANAGLVHTIDTQHTMYKAICGVEGIRWITDETGKPRCGLCIEEREEIRLRTPPKQKKVT